MNKSRIAIAALIILAGAQVLIGNLRRRGETPPVPLLLGDVMPTKKLEPLSLGTGMPSGCWQAFVVDPECPACNGAADSLGGNSAYQGYWVVAGTQAPRDEFLARHQINKTAAFGLPGASAAAALLDLGIFSTPTRVIIRPDGVIGDLRMSGRPATQDVFDEACVESS